MNKALRLLRVSSIWLSILAVAPAAFGKDNVILILDSSQSMWGQIERRSKSEIAREVLTRQIRESPESDANYGLIAFGHRRTGDCSDIEELVPVRPLDPELMIDTISALKPKGTTPLTAAIEAAVERLKPLQGNKSIVLLTDGMEECGGDPCETVERLRQETPFNMQVVGFDIPKEDQSIQLQCLAKAGGGNYFTAATSEGLMEALAGAAKLGSGGLGHGADKSYASTHIVLDVSSAMAGPFGETTRIDAARNSLGEVLAKQAADRDNLALRTYGGNCTARTEENSRLVNKFSQNNGGQIRASLLNTRPQGQATLRDAVLMAIRDYSDESRFGAMNKRLLIIVGGGDDCVRNNVMSEIRARLDQLQIKPDFRYIGIGLNPEELTELNEVAKGTGGSLKNVHSEAELKSALDFLMEVQPVLGSVQVVVRGVNSTTQDIDRLKRWIESGRLDDAEELIPRLESALASSTNSYRDLGRRKERDEFRTLFDISMTLRETQGKVIEQSRILVTAKRKGDALAVLAATANLDRLIEEFKAAARRGNEVIKRLAAEQEQLDMRPPG